MRPHCVAICSLMLLASCSDQVSLLPAEQSAAIEQEVVAPVPREAIGPRESNSSCLAGDAPVEPIYLDQVFSDVSLSKPIHFQQAPGGTDSPIYIAEKNGRIVAIPADDDATDEQVTVALRLQVQSHGESGVTGFTFHPDYSVNGQVYVSYGTEPTPGALEHRLSVFQRQADGLTFGEEDILLNIAKDNAEHFGGALAFGPDGFLYYSIGDDGDNLDGDYHPDLAQDPQSLLGSILRIDVDNASADQAYSIPNDNPDFTGTGPNEIWAQGYRNPWRMAFDREPPHALWASDVGAREKEEINVIGSADNHGWPACEGACDPADSAYVDPVFSYSNIGGAASIGGFVYRGAAIPELYGKYVFADYVAQKVFQLDPELLPNEPLYVQDLLDVPFAIAGFGEDNAAELYALDFTGGGVYRFARNQQTDDNGPADLLSETGCFASLSNGDPVPASGVIDYETSQKFWSDGAEKRRQLALPDGEVLSTTDANNWQLPVGGVTIKHFYWQQKIIESRFLVRHDESQFSGYTYEWNEAQTDAALVPSAGRTVALEGGLEWEYPSRSNCSRCHSEQAGYTLSLESRQLNVADVEGHSQIDNLAQFGYLDSVAPVKSDAFPGVEQLTDDAIPLGQRAASWLHVNCSSCHRGAGSAGRAEWDARYDATLAQRRLCEVLPFEPVSGLAQLEALLAPGSHEHSTLWLRASARDTPFSMPPISSTRVDEAGVALVAEWIDALESPCPPLGDTVPGRVQAQDYEQSFDLTAGNLGQVDLCDGGDDMDLVQTSDAEGSCAIGLTDPGEWAEYDVNVTQAGTYTFVLRAASGASPNGRSATMEVRVGDTILASAIPVAANGWASYQDIEVPGIELAAGNQVVRITFSSGFVNLNYFEVR